MSRWPSWSQKQKSFRWMNYHPNEVQVPIHRSRAAVLQIVGAEGAGKSFVTAAEVVACLPWCRLIYLVGQTYENTAPEFNYIVEWLLALGAVDLLSVSRPKQGGWQLLTRTHCRLETLSVERGASAIIARGAQPDLIVLTEAGIISSQAVLLAAVRRATRTRGRVILVGTLRDNFGWYANLIDDLSVKDNAWRGQTYNLPAWTNRVLYPGGREDPEIKRLEAILPEDEFKRTVAAERVQSQALVFPEFSYASHVRPCPFDPALGVTLWIDPGYFPSAYVVLAVQFHGQEVWIIDEVYLNHHTHEQVIEICRGRSWWAKVERAVIDVAGRQHHAERSAEEVWRQHGLWPHSRPVGVLDGISRHRTFLAGSGGPRLFHDPRCKQTCREYQKYRRPTDREGQVTSDLPVDKDNHAMKAIAYGLVDRFGFVDGQRCQSAVIPRGDIIAEIDRGEW